MDMVNYLSVILHVRVLALQKPRQYKVSEFLLFLEHIENEQFWPYTIVKSGL